jgi:hypothetical protein
MTGLPLVRVQQSRRGWTSKYWSQSRQAALLELSADYASAELGYENAMWLLQVLLDEEFHDEGQLKDEDRVGYERGEY